MTTRQWFATVGTALLLVSGAGAASMVYTGSQVFRFDPVSSTPAVAPVGRATEYYKADAGMVMQSTGSTYVPRPGTFVFNRSKMVSSGDSITAHNFGFDSHAEVSAARAGLTLTNLGVNVYQAIDAASYLTSVRITGNHVTTVLIGTNDHIYYQTDANKRTVYKEALRGIILWAGVPDKQKIRMQNVTLGGTPIPPRTPTLGTGAGSSPLYGWSNVQGAPPPFSLPAYGDTAANGNLAITTVADNASLIMTINGTTVWCEIAIRNGGTGTYKITIDGVDQGPFSTGAVGGVTLTSQLGLTWAQRMHRFSGLAAGDHTVTITALNLGGGTQLLTPTWCTGNGWIDPGARPKVVVGTIPSMTAYSAPDSSANVTTYNTDVATIVSEAVADGLNVVLVDVRSALSNGAPNYTATAGLMYDTTHPNGTGQYIVSNVFMAEMVRP